MNKILGTFKTSQNLSSETLFHFTNSIDILELILKNGFQARYIYEKIPGRKLAYFTKTVCFCDIPLGLIKEHINWYGTYGIGINRPDARDQGLSPVFYIHSKSPEYPKGSSKKTKEWFEVFPFTIYLKQVRGKQKFLNKKNELIYKWKTFYNEREWRYFPSDKKVDVVQYEKEVELERNRDLLNKEVLPFFEFDLDWIEYILIKDYKEVNRLIKIFKSNKYKDKFELLLTKVITFKQIKNDF